MHPIFKQKFKEMLIENVDISSIVIKTVEEAKLHEGKDKL
jgi:hypothetical protein